MKMHGVNNIKCVWTCYGFERHVITRYVRVLPLTVRSTKQSFELTKCEHLSCNLKLIITVADYVGL